MVKATGKHYTQCIRAETLGVGTSVTAEDLIEAMSDTYLIAGGCDKEDSDEDAGSLKESVLVTGSFQYNCYNCGKNCHKVHECPEKKGNKTPSGPRSGTCEEC